MIVRPGVCRMRVRTPRVKSGQAGATEEANSTELYFGLDDFQSSSSRSERIDVLGESRVFKFFWFAGVIRLLWRGRGVLETSL